jgi:hypothetical protein
MKELYLGKKCLNSRNKSVCIGKPISIDVQRSGGHVLHTDRSIFYKKEYIQKRIFKIHLFIYLYTKHAFFLNASPIEFDNFVFGRGVKEYLFRKKETA